MTLSTFCFVQFSGLKLLASIPWKPYGDVSIISDVTIPEITLEFCVVVIPESKLLLKIWISSPGLRVSKTVIYSLSKELPL